MKLAEMETYQRIGSEPKNTKKLYHIENIVAGLAGILTSRALFAGVMAPLGIAWYGANIKNDKHYIILIGTIVGSLLMGAGLLSIKYILAAVLLMLLRKIIHTALWDKPLFCGVVSAATVFCCSLLLMAWKGFLYYDLIMAALEAFIICGVSMVFSRAKAVFLRGGYVTCDDESIAIAILAGAAVAGLQGISFLGVSLANILSLYIILIAGYKNGMSISGAIGAALGMIMGAAENNIAFMTGTYAFIGITAGAMRSLGPLGVAVGAAFANAGFAAYYGGAGAVWLPIIEAAIGAVCFYFTPSNVFQAYEKILVKDSGDISEETQLAFYKKKINHVMNRMRQALSEMGELLVDKEEEQVAEQEEMMGAICERLASKVCEGCSIHHYCWVKNPKATYKLFQSVVGTMERPGMDIDEKWRKIVQDKCIKSEELLGAATHLYGIYRSEMMLRQKKTENRHMVADQLLGVAGVLERQREMLEQFGKRERELETELYKTLYRSGVTIKGMNVLEINDRYTVVLEVAPEMAEVELEPIVGSVLERRMQLADTQQMDNGMLWMEFRERYRLQYEAAIVKLDQKNGNVSGDNSSKFVTENGELHCILSDGMGSGEKAAEDSKTAVALYERLIRAGYEPTAALRTMNTSMIAAKENESCTTADIVCADLNTGTVKFIKAGAAATVIKTAAETKAVRWGSMPLGILPMEEIEFRCEQVESPTYIAMMTDGIPDNIGDRIEGENYLCGIVDDCGEKSCKQIADEMMVAALAKGLPKDDMTAVVVKLF